MRPLWSYGVDADREPEGSPRLYGRRRYAASRGAATAIAGRILDAARDVALFGNRSARLLRGKTPGIISRTV
jgi:hypothetical protein